MTRSSSEILKRIEETHTRIGELAEAIASKVDMRRQAEDFVADKKDSLLATADAVVSDVTDTTEDTGDRPPEPPPGAHRKRLSVAVGTLTIGFRLGKRLGEQALTTGEDVLARMRNTGRDTDERGDQSSGSS